MPVALLYLYSEAGSFAVLDLHALPLGLTAQKLAFPAAFAVKVPMWPVHTWLPDAHVEAPTGGVMDVGVDEDVDEVLVEVGVDLLPAQRPLGELVAPVAPLGREQQEERPPSPVALDHAVGIVMEVHAGIDVLVGKGRNRHGQPQGGASNEQRTEAGTDRGGHRYRRARSSRTFPRSASLPSPPPTRPASAPSPSSRRMVSGWAIE